MTADKENIEESIEEKTDSAETAADMTDESAADGDVAVDDTGTANVEENNVDETAADDSDKDADDCSDGVSDNQKGSKKKLFAKKEPKKDKKDMAIEELTDKHQRLMAEFQNFRSRTEKEKTAMYEIGAKSIIEKILPVVDNFERGFTTMSQEDKASPVGQGMEMIYKQFLAALDDMGVTPIEAVGSEFNPDFHNAVMHVEDDGFGENIVAEEFQKGYMYRDAVVRHSMVKVAN